MGVAYRDKHTPYSVVDSIIARILPKVNIVQKKKLDKLTSLCYNGLAVVSVADDTSASDTTKKSLFD